MAALIQSNWGQALQTSLQPLTNRNSSTASHACRVRSIGNSFFFPPSLALFGLFCTNENQALEVMLLCVYNKTSLIQMQLIYNL